MQHTPPLHTLAHSNHKHYKMSTKTGPRKPSQNDVDTASCFFNFHPIGIKPEHWCPTEHQELISYCGG